MDDAHQATNYPDPADRASAEEAQLTADRVQAQLRRAADDAVAPRPDGECACGCGAEVEPARLALGYGLAVGCAARREALRKQGTLMSLPTFERRVVCAAHRLGEHIVCSPRHFDRVAHAQMDAYKASPDALRRVSLGEPFHWEQGFVDQHGVFLTRAQALAVAQLAGQVACRVGGDEVALYSENLY